MFLLRLLFGRSERSPERRMYRRIFYTGCVHCGRLDYEVSYSQSHVIVVTCTECETPYLVNPEWGTAVKLARVSSMVIEADEFEARELLADTARQRLYQHRIIHHPDCRDPDHPGCEKCEPVDDD